VLRELFPYLSDFENIRPMLMRQLAAARIAQLRVELGRLYYFDSEHPSGHYALRLGSPHDRLVRLVATSPLVSRSVRLLCIPPAIFARAEPKQPLPVQPIQCVIQRVR
jgi:hypothetical protein